ncbi:MAG: DUF3105 domain-containing protein [Chloroflexi bacterium]|nr:DUF3105 domain-containing protein [Chloroflexota bacterium]
MGKKRRSQGKKKSQVKTKHATSPSAPRKTSTARERREAERKARIRRRRLTRAGVVIAIATVIGLIGLYAVRFTSTLPGERVPDMGNTHITQAEAAVVKYNSKPPTSGPHFGQLASWGVHDTVLPDGVIIHNLEDGGVGIWYDCPDGCPELTAQLEGLIEEMGEDRLVMGPYPELDARIVLTAWNRIDKLDEFDRDRIIAFINAFRGIDQHR